jgi:HEAT repeat protein
MSALAQAVGDPQSQLQALEAATPETNVQGLIESLGAQGCTEAIPTIASHLGDRRTATRLAAAKALTLLHDPERRVLAVLEELLRSPRVEDQTMAVEQLSMARALPPRRS